MPQDVRCKAIIRDNADIASIIHTDPWRGNDGLVDVGFDKLCGSTIATMNLPGARFMSMALRTYEAMQAQDFSS